MSFFICTECYNLCVIATSVYEASFSGEGNRMYHQERPAIACYYQFIVNRQGFTHKIGLVHCYEAFRG